MIENTDDLSTSGFVSSPKYAVSGTFSEYSEMASRGYCRLFKAQRNGQWFVLKTLKEEYQQDPVYQGMIEKEYDLMMQLNHPNIVRIYSKEEDSVADACMVMEYVDGRTLDDFIKENPSRSVRDSVARQILAAIGYCHSKQIIHRDLKPSNILVTYNGNNVKLIDFGLSDSDQYAVLKESAYTKAYAAPEQLSGGEVDNRTDLYAFGLILRQLFPKRYARVVRKCTQPQKEKRYASAAEVMNAMASADRWKKKVLFILASLLMLGILIPIIVHMENKANPSKKMDTEVVKETQAHWAKSDSRTDSAALTASVVPTRTKVQADNTNPNTDMDILEQYCHNLKFELDSIWKPFEKELEKGSIVCNEQFANHKQIAQLKMSIHIRQHCLQLPQNKRYAFQHYAEDLWNRYSARHSGTDAEGNDLYSSYSDLHRKGNISDKEYARLIEEEKKDFAEIKRLGAYLRQELAKDCD